MVAEFVILHEKKKQQKTTIFDAKRRESRTNYFFELMSLSQLVWFLMVRRWL